jgi:hypothetical protein
MKLDLQTRDLTTGDRGPKAFTSEEEALAWLKERPKNIDVLGVASHHVPKDVGNQLKAAMRPLDEAERALVSKLDEAEVAAIRKQAEARRDADQLAAAARAKEMVNADPNREMNLRWTYNVDLRITEAGDTREISDEVKAVVDAWIAERQEWVEGRGQMVGDATIQVWPAELPDGTTERIIMGTFIPVTA